MGGGEGSNSVLSSTARGSRWRIGSANRAGARIRLRIRKKDIGKDKSKNNKKDSDKDKDNDNSKDTFLQYS